jgi:hypothetical protein
MVGSVLSTKIRRVVSVAVPLPLVAMIETVYVPSLTNVPDVFFPFHVFDFAPTVSVESLRLFITVLDASRMFKSVCAASDKVNLMVELLLPVAFRLDGLTLTDEMDGAAYAHVIHITDNATIANISNTPFPFPNFLIVYFPPKMRSLLLRTVIDSVSNSLNIMQGKI